jgi:DNA ligase 1
MNTKVLQQISETTKRLEKERLLGQLTERDGVFLKWACDPAITFGVTVDESVIEDFRTARVSKMHDHKKWWDAFNHLCEDLSSRTVTGNAALNDIATLMWIAPSADDVTWACRILNKDLRAGFGANTIEKAFPGLIEPFEVALAKPYDPAKHELQGNWIIDSKLDGLRGCIVGGVAYTRNGRVIETVGHILAELKHLTDDWVFDGEIMGAGDFDESSGDIRRKSTGTDTSIYYNIFDMVPIAQWKARDTAPLWQRKEDITNLLLPPGKMLPCAFDKRFKHVRIVEWLTLPKNPTAQQLFEMRDKMIARGYEGAMIKDMDSPYIFGRSDKLLKLKDFRELDGRIVGIKDGRGKHKGKLGALLVEFDGVVTNVGSGFTDSQRSEDWESRIGEIVEVQYQNKSSSGALRFPVFVRRRCDKD